MNAAFLASMTRTRRARLLPACSAVSVGLLLAACSPATPSRTPSPSPRSVATATPSPLSSPTPAPSLIAVPDGSGFEPNSVTFVSIEMGWALGGAPCSSGTCVALRRTLNGGRSWSAVGAPPALFSPASEQGQGVSQIRFANSFDGWAFGPDLWSTHDGGLHWTKIGLTDVSSLETAAGLVHAVALDQSTDAFAFETSVTRRDAWVKSGSLQLGAGPVPESDLVLQGSTGWVIENDREVIDGARLVAGRWLTWRAPCDTTGGTGVIAAPTVSSLVAICEQGIWGPSGYQGPPAVRAYFSDNGGATFFLGGTVPGGQAGASGDVVASPARGAAVTDVLTNTNQSELLETLNFGASWRIVATAPPSMLFTYLGFTSSSQGVAIESGRPTSMLLMTFDGGRVWSPVRF